VLEQIRENISSVEEFFYESYKGFYCSICNYENHRFFNLERREINFSEKFCRDIIERTLNYLLFFHIDIGKFANLVSKFLVSCDKKGEYEADVPIPPQFVFIQDEETVLNLSNCRRERNHSSWFINCQKVCEKFEISSFSDFFEPELKKLNNYVQFMKSQ
jgi:hypothetical protein